MAAPGPFELEGRLNGLRDILEIVVRHLVAGGAEDVRAALEALATSADGQEDSGAVPQAAFAAEAAAAREARLVLEAALAGIERNR